MLVVWERGTFCELIVLIFDDVGPNELTSFEAARLLK